MKKIIALLVLVALLLPHSLKVSAASVPTITPKADWKKAVKVDLGKTYVKPQFAKTGYLKFVATKNGTYTFKVSNVRKSGKDTKSSYAQADFTVQSIDNSDSPVTVKDSKGCYMQATVRSTYYTSKYTTDYPTTYSTKISGIKKGDVVYLRTSGHIKSTKYTLSISCKASKEKTTKKIITTSDDDITIITTGQYTLNTSKQKAGLVALKLDKNKSYRVTTNNVIGKGICKIGYFHYNGNDVEALPLAYDSNGNSVEVLQLVSLDNSLSDGKTYFNYFYLDIDMVDELDNDYVYLGVETNNISSVDIIFEEK